MKIALAQIRPIAGDVRLNQEKHEFFIQQAAKQGAEIVAFPELSLTGYEPRLAAALAFDPWDARLKDFQKLSNEHAITIAVGLPIRANTGVTISMAVFQPHHNRQFYAKQYLHADEELYFVPGTENLTIKVKERGVAFAICYEIFVPEHAEQAMRNGAVVYLASVAKSASGVERALLRLPAVARQYKVPVLMVNSVGPADDFVAAGNSVAWNEEGEVLQTLNLEEGILILDLEF